MGLIPGLKSALNFRLTNKERGDSRRLLANAYESWLEHIQPITVPLALISQIQRSGGSMLSQLFDGHPEIHAHPYELKVGYPDKYNWPPIDLRDPPKLWFEILFEDDVLWHFRDGYKKMEKYKDTFLFLFLPSLQKKIFLNYFAAKDKISQRDVFDAYMTSYFGAWVNNQNLFGNKKLITAFTPRLAFTESNMLPFFETYPDGRLISVVRDPKNWFPSANRHQEKNYGDITKALDQWNESARSIVRNKKKYGDRVCILTFENLVQQTESVMRCLADFLEIRFDDILLMPTFNKIPIKPNTSFTLEKPGIITSAVERYKTLSRKEFDTIETMTGDAYSQVLRMVTSIS
jgi:hypothetical protein